MELSVMKTTATMAAAQQLQHCNTDWHTNDTFHRYSQWRRQDLLREGAKMENMSWGNHGGLQHRVQQRLMTNSFVTETDRKSCELSTSVSANLADYRILG